MNRLILGLGNPGDEYRATRHNLGFRVVEELARRWRAPLDRLECNAKVASARVALAGPPSALVSAADQAPAADLASAGEPAPGRDQAVSQDPAASRDVNHAADGAPGAGDAVSGALDVLLVQPQTYMNRSGFAARCLVELHAVAPESVLVVYDEVNLPFGRLRLRRSGSPAGHRGIESILENLRTDQVPRLRLGIAADGGPVAAEALVGFVLSPFSAAEEEALAPVVERAADACETWVREGIDAAMGRFNGG